MSVIYFPISNIWEKSLEEKLTKKGCHFCHDYLNQRPREFLLLLATEELPYFKVPPPLVQLWSEEVPRLAAQEVFRTYVRDLFDYFSALFEKRLQL